MARKSGSLNLNGIFDTCKRFGWFFESEADANVATVDTLGATVNGADAVANAAAAAATAATAADVDVVIVADALLVATDVDIIGDNEDDDDDVTVDGVAVATAAVAAATAFIIFASITDAWAAAVSGSVCCNESGWAECTNCR